MKAIMSTLIALSVLAGIAGPVAAADYSVGPPSQWQPQDPSSSPH